MTQVSAPPASLTRAQRAWRVVIAVGLIAVFTAMVMVVPARGGHGEIGPGFAVPFFAGATAVAAVALLVAHVLPPAYRDDDKKATDYAVMFGGAMFAVAIVIVFRLLYVVFDWYTRFSDGEIGLWFACAGTSFLLIGTHALRAWRASRRP